MHATPFEIHFGQLSLRFLVDGPASGASATVFELIVQPGAKVPAAHFHNEFDETCYGLDGVLTLTVEGKRIELGPGDSLFIPRGAVHRFDNFSSQITKSLAIITPGILGSSYFQELGQLLRSSAGGPPDPTAVAAIMLRHGLTPVPAA